MNKKILLIQQTLLFLVFGVAKAILSGYDQYVRITDNPSFGCRWHGGLGATLTCRCQPNAEEFYIKEGSISTFDLQTIEVDNCNKVKFGDKAIHGMRNLRTLQLTNIQDLILEDWSLNWEGYVTHSDINTPSLKIRISNCSIQDISSHTFKGKLNEIAFNSAIIENISPFAFSSLIQNQHIIFTDTKIRNVEPQAFKKFSSEYIGIINSEINYLPSRSFSELTVTENLLIMNSTFDAIRPAAFLIYNPKRFEVTNSEFMTLEGEAFKVMTRGDVLFKNDIFNITHPGAFAGINVNFNVIRVRKLITFDSLTFASFTSQSLDINTTSFDSKITNIRINQECDCDFLDNVFEETHQLEEFKCILNENEIISFKDVKVNLCSTVTSHATIIIVVCVVLILVIVIGTGLVVYFKKVYKNEKYGGKTLGKDGKLSMIVPDGRTYRETELHVIVERADLLTTDL